MGIDKSGQSQRYIERTSRGVELTHEYDLEDIGSGLVLLQSFQSVHRRDILLLCASHTMHKNLRVSDRKVHALGRTYLQVHGIIFDQEDFVSCWTVNRRYGGCNGR